MEKILPTVVMVTFTSIVITAGGATNNLSAGDFIVDCSGCQYAPISDVNAYSCNVRCETKGNITRGRAWLIQTRLIRTFT